MHISEGVLSPAILVSGAALTVAGTAIGLKRIDAEEIPSVGILSAKVRAFRAGTNMHTYRTYAHMVGMLLVRSADRGERVHRAMICRGFSGRFYSLKTFTFKATDLWVLLFSLALVATLGLLEWTTIL